MSTVQKKVLPSGGNKNPSFVVSIPIKWCEKLGIVNGSVVFLTLDGSRIVISTWLEDKQEARLEDKKGDTGWEQRFESRFE